MDFLTSNKLKKSDCFMYSSFQNFIIGIGSVLDLHGSYYFISFGESDSEKIRDDWRAIGDDMRKSYYSELNKVGHEW